MSMQATDSSKFVSDRGIFCTWYRTALVFSQGLVLTFTSLPPCCVDVESNTFHRVSSPICLLNSDMYILCIAMELTQTPVEPLTYSFPSLQVSS